jgi:formylglycine-generating enzyme required for sulfatase activity/tRNA A-37 threonylcarbamoyl transferase component Bud32
MQICQNPNCSNPFNDNGNEFCLSCGQSNFGTILRNRFRVFRLLGEGGFSRTYAAEDVDRLNSPCVIKQFFPQLQGTLARAKAAELFKEEAFRLYELGENHPQIPRLLAYFEQASSLYLVQEFIPGPTLLNEVQATPLTQEEIRKILNDLLPVLQFIHERNVIHRDIKPENIIKRIPHSNTSLSKRSSGGDLVLIDFGGAKQVTQTTIARRATGIFTIGYAPNEQMAGFASPASDLYALGATCIRLLTQCFPIQDDYGQIYDPLYDAMSAEWLWRERLQEKGLKVSDDLGKIFDKLLNFVARDRYQSAAEVINDLKIAKTDVSVPFMTFLQPKIPLSGQSTPSVQASQPETSQPQVSQTPTLAQRPKTQITSLPPLKVFEFDVATVNGEGREISRIRRSAKFFAEDLGKEIILEMVSVTGGTFMMGSPASQEHIDECPQHPVTIEPFFVGKFPITQAQWQAVAALAPVKMPLITSPSKYRGANLPVENVSWHEAEEFCARLTKKTGRNYRLPSEAEWEYACCAGTNTPFHFGETITTELANYNGNFTYALENKGVYRKKTTPVGSFGVANAFGLYDMHGLVWEWCADPWHKNYNGAPCDGSIWEVGGDIHRRVLRGGAWNFSPTLCRSASRSWNEVDGGLRISGFRVVFSV